jgi:hypothetical protein
MKTVPDRLTELGNIYRERNKAYGSDYHRHGKMMMALLPRGVVLKTEHAFRRYNIFKQIVAKIARFAVNFDSGGHADSLDDISVYAQMLRELDEIGEPSDE